MKAVLLRKLGGPEKLDFACDHPTPTIGPNEALVHVRACSLNHLDIWVRQGLPTLKLTLPHILGCDVSGEVAEVGEKVNEWKKGDQVVVSPGISCWQCHFCKSGRDNLCATYGILGEHAPGGYAEFVRVKGAQLIPKPANLSFEETAAYPLTFLTAWHMLVTQAELNQNKSVLILGAGSGIGVAAIQIAKLFGARLIVGTSSSETKLKQAKTLGLTHDILTDRERPQGFYREILKTTGGEGVDIVFEHIGPATMPDSIRSVKKGGIVVTCGATSGPQTPVDLRYFFTREIRLQGSLMGTLSELKKITQRMEEKKLKPVIDSVFELKDAKQAHEKMATRNFFGKIILKV